MGLLSFLRRKKKYATTHTPAPVQAKKEVTISPELLKARKFAEAIVKKTHYPEEIPAVATAYGITLHAYNKSGFGGSKELREALNPLLHGISADLSLFKSANEIIDNFDTVIYEYTITDDDGTIRTAYYSRETSRIEVKMAIDFLTWEHATVQAVADHYQVSRSTAANRFKSLKENDYVLWKNVQNRLDENKKVSLAKAVEARKKKS